LKESEVEPKLGLKDSAVVAKLSHDALTVILDDWSGIAAMWLLFAIGLGVFAAGVGTPSSLIVSGLSRPGSIIIPGPSSSE